MADDPILRASFDPDADAVYIHLQPASVLQPSVATTLPAGPSINLDFDGEGRLVGIEVLGSHKLVPELVAELGDRS